MSTRRLAISYSRFSDPKQAKGDSETRQDQLFRDFCSLHNLTPLGEIFADRGKSGYKDEHRKKGRLGVLIGGLKRVREHGGSVNLVCTNPQIKKIFDITGLVKIFGIFDSEGVAMKALV